MSRKSLDQTLEFISAVDRARTQGEICAALLATARRFGFAHILAGTIPRPGASPRQQMSHVVLESWPHDWAARYFGAGYLYVDPAIRRVASRAATFAWSELAVDCRDDVSARRVMDEAGDFKLRAGLTVPLVTAEGELAGISLAGERIDESPTARATVTLVASYAFSRAMTLSDAARRANPTLTAREREALQWAAEGRPDFEIADRMGITVHGVDKHLRSVRSKLRARNRTHAVAEGIRWGLIE